jgi:hypothetical protein
MRRPPALGAIVALYFSDRRYTDDCHYKGGALQMLYDVGTYGLAMVARNLLPPRPDLVGEQWAAIWEEHLQNEPWLLRWLAHPTEDEQWRHGSLCEDYRAVQCPTFLIGGWRDGYTNCNLRTFARLTCPKKLLIGPWLHIRPHEGIPGPRINWHREAARFFAHWLRDEDTGIMAEPPIALYVQQYDPPDPLRRHTTGSWRFGLAARPRPRRDAAAGRRGEPHAGGSGGRPDRRRPARLPPRARHHLRDLLRRWTVPPARRPAQRGGLLRRLHHAAPHGAGRDPRLAEGGSLRLVERRGDHLRRPPLRRGARW